MDPQSITNAIDSGLNQVGAQVRQVHKRVVTKTGSDQAQLLGRATIETTDTLLTPQPRYSRLGKKAPLMSTNQKTYFPSDLSVLFTPTMITADELNSGVLFVLKDDKGREEVYEVYDVDDTAAISGVAVLYVVILRSKQR